MAPVVLGRQAELDQLTAMLDAVVAGPRAVVVEGPAGIGKTTVWQAALEAARARSRCWPPAPPRPRRPCPLLG
jgi:predicted ATPase